MPDSSAPASRQTLAAAFLATRAETVAFTDGLAREDFVLQSMPDASPLAWHLAHTTWFFEEFVLAEAEGARFEAFHPRFRFLFNSYYEAVGARVARADRGLMSRPTVDEILEYRREIDRRVAGLLDAERQPRELEERIRLGLQHEQQHQELMATDLLHAFAANPMEPAIVPGAAPRRSEEVGLTYVSFDEGLREIGVAPGAREFHFDNEGPRHRVLVEAFTLANRPVTNGEWLEFMGDDGYGTASLWLSEGWTRVQDRDDPWEAPLHWRRARDGAWSEFTPAGLLPLDPHAPVRHVSHFEADAFARWAGARLPTEAEWEAAAAEVEHAPGTFREDGTFVPRIEGGAAPLASMLGGVWEWTASPYVAYPRYRPAPGALGEYNGKFMSRQMVLRGGSCATPRSHIRPTYRNFFPPDARWQFSGVRLARDTQ